MEKQQKEGNVISKAQKISRSLTARYNLNQQVFYIKLESCDYEWTQTTLNLFSFKG